MKIDSKHCQCSTGPTGISDFFDRNMGLLTPYSHVSHTILSYTDEMSFTERCYNTVVSLYDWILRRWVHIPAQNEIAKRHFAHLEPLPSVDDLIKNVSLILANAHRSIFHPRPSMPTLINIGGAQIKMPKPLPVYLKKYLDESKHGVIYFSLGTVVQSSKMPKEKLKAILGKTKFIDSQTIKLNVLIFHLLLQDSFKQLKHRVLWKFEDESLTNVSSNVMIQKWLPQNDILAHPNVVLFISHGGMFSNFESIARGVPMLLIPFISDQYRNAQKVEKAGYGKFLEFRDITTESLTAALNEMLTNKKYSERVKEISAIFNDNLVHPMDEAIWWIEYVCRFKGAKHCKSHVVNMSWFTYLLLDVYLIAIIAIVVGAYIAYSLLKKMFRPVKSDDNLNKKQN